MFTSPKIGRFEIDAETINDNPEVVQAVMATCIVVDVQPQWHKKSLLYTAISEQFADTDPACDAPLYDINIAEDGTVTWAKQEN